MYLNTSGNVRDGQAFVLVKRDGREYHIYGTGKDRTIVEPQAAGREGATRRRRRPPTDDRTTSTDTGTQTGDVADGLARHRQPLGPSRI